MNNANRIKQTLFDTIYELSLEHREFLVNVDSDYTRNRKLYYKITRLKNSKELQTN